MSSRNPQPPLSHAFLRRPMLWAAALFTAGIFAHSILPAHPETELISAAALLIVALLWHKRAWATIALGTAIFLLGLSRAQQEAFFFPPGDIARFTSDEPSLAQLELRIETEPRLMGAGFTSGASSPSGASRPLPARQIAQARILRLRTIHGWLDASGRVQLTVRDPHPDLAINQTLRATGLLARPAPARNPGQYDWQSYDRQQRICATFSIPHRENIQVLSSSGRTLLDSLRLRSRRALQLGFSQEQSLDHALLRALVLGDPDPQLRDVQDQFIRTGTSHHLAISGMHIAVLAGLVYFLCKLLFLPPRAARLAALSAALVYGLLALPSPPVMRSVFLCIAFCLGPVFRRRTDALQLLSLSVLAMLIDQPLDLYNAGFQLSFGTVLGLILFTRPALEAIRGLKDPDLLVAPHVPVTPDVHPVLRVHAVFRAVFRWLRDAMVTGIIAWLVSAPLIAFHFTQLNPWAILASVALAPCVFLALTGGILKIILTLLFPSLAGHFALAAAWPIMLMRHMVGWLDTWPASDAILSPPSIAMLILYYGLLLLPLLPSGASRFIRLSPALAVVLLLFPLFLAATRAPTSTPARFTLLSVGKGQCAILQLPTGQNYVFDAGASSGSDLMHSILLPSFRALGMTHIDGIFLSRPTPGRISAAALLLSLHPEAKVYLTPHFRDDSHWTARQFMQSLDRAPHLLVAGDQINLGPGASIRIFWPPANQNLQGGDASLVLRLEINGHSILLPGDADQSAELSLLRSNINLNAEVFLAPRQGAADEQTAAIVKAVSPHLILCSDGPAQSRADIELDRLGQGATLLRTHRDGAITIQLPAAGPIGVSAFLHGG